MDFNKFTKYARTYNTIPVFRKMAADLITPATVYLNLRKAGVHSFLLESVEGGENIGRYSFIGVNPVKIISNKGSQISVIQNEILTQQEGSVFDYLQEEFNNTEYVSVEGLPSFTGGMVGYLAYENISLIENVIHFNHSSENPDSIFGLYKTIIAFDHYKHQTIIINNIRLDPSRDLKSQYDEGLNELDNLQNRINNSLNYNPDFCLKSDIKVNIKDGEFTKMVLEAKNNITEGDVFSDRFIKKILC